MKRISQFALIMVICLLFGSITMAADTIPVGIPIPMTGWAAGKGPIIISF